MHYAVLNRPSAYMRNRMKVVLCLRHGYQSRGEARSICVSVESAWGTRYEGQKLCISQGELADIQHEEDAAVDEQGSDSIEVDEENE